MIVGSLTLQCLKRLLSSLLPDDKSIVVPLEDGVRLTREQSIYRGEFFAFEASSTCREPLVVLLPEATSRVRLVAFEIVVDCHEDSDFEDVWAQENFSIVSCCHLSWFTLTVACLYRIVAQRVDVPVQCCLEHVVPLVHELRVFLESECTSASARAYFDASRWPHLLGIGVPDQLSSKTPLKRCNTQSCNSTDRARRCVLHFCLDTFPSQVHVDKPSTR